MRECTRAWSSPHEVEGDRDITLSRDHLRPSAANFTRVCMTAFASRCTRGTILPDEDMEIGGYQRYPDKHSCQDWILRTSGYVEISVYALSGLWTFRDMNFRNYKLSGLWIFGFKLPYMSYTCTPILASLEWPGHPTSLPAYCTDLHTCVKLPSLTCRRAHLSKNSWKASKNKKFIKKT